MFIFRNIREKLVILIYEGMNLFIFRIKKIIYNY